MTKQVLLVMLNVKKCFNDENRGLRFLSHSVEVTLVAPAKDGHQ